MKPRQTLSASTVLLFPMALACGLLAACGGSSSDGHGPNDGHDSHGEAAHGTPHFSYEGETGPERWGDLSEDWVLAKTGREQSPIDLVADQAMAGESTLELSYQDSPVTLLHNGHTVQMNYAPGSSMAIDGASYALKQFHFHTPSEHTLNGEATPMEVHLVHQNSDGDLAVLGVMVVAGEENAFLAKFWNVLPTEEAPAVTHDDLSVNVADLLPANRSFFRYEGSLTTPPCTEGVRWTVLQDPVEASQAQIDKLHGIMGSNARPVQPLNERTLQLVQ